MVKSEARKSLAFGVLTRKALLPSNRMPDAFTPGAPKIAFPSVCRCQFPIESKAVLPVVSSKCHKWINPSEMFMALHTLWAAIRNSAGRTNRTRARIPGIYTK